MTLDKLRTQIEEASKPLEGINDRNYTGLSGWKECSRLMYYKAKGTPQKPFDSRVYRIFRQGHDGETQVVEVLKKVPQFYIEEHDPETGRQFEVSFYGGHVKGHFDGRVKSEFYFGETSKKLLEIKTANERNFNSFKKHGVKKTNETYYAQVQTYMLGSQEPDTWDNPALTQCLFIVFNKNTAELHIEMIDYSPNEAQYYLDCFYNSITARELPPKISDNPNWYQCKFCDFAEHCHKDKPIELNLVRQCKFTQPNITSGNWYCTNEGCEYYNQKAESTGDKCLSINE